jgi:4-diphosphocytidyl-2-C-methyl-D-erythritol kinase
LDGFQSFPAPAKLNLHLRVLGRRADGYHLLDTEFVLLDVGDTVRLRVRADGRIQRSVTSEMSDISEGEDLTLRAARLLQQRTGAKCGVDIALEKYLPVGAGLGGGSSDAATTLLVLNKLWGTHLSRAELMRIGIELGADVPFFIFGEQARASGIGEQLRASAPAPACYVVLDPRVAVSTREAFALFDLTHTTPDGTISSLSQGAVRSEGNDLEPVVCARYPEVMRHLSWLKRFGDARMTGSGSCVFLACDDAARAQRIFTQRPPDMVGFVAHALAHHPLKDFC